MMVLVRHLTVAELFIRAHRTGAASAGWQGDGASRASTFLIPATRVLATRYRAPAWSAA